MRMRRTLAFVLTLAMLLGNVMPAYATEGSNTTDISGSVTITTDENGNPVIINNEDETPELEDDNEELENSGDVDDGEETPEDDVTPEEGEEPDASQGGDEGEDPDASQGGEEGEDPNASQGEEGQTPEGGDDTTPEEDETQGAVSDNDVGEKEVNKPIVRTGGEGAEEKYISVSWMEDTILKQSEESYATIAEAVAAADTLLNDGTVVRENVTISLPGSEQPGFGETFSVSERDLVVNDLHKITLDLNGNEIKAVKDTEGNSVIECNINVQDGTINLTETGMTFKILERIGVEDKGTNDLNMQDLSFTGRADSILIIGDNREGETEESRANATEANLEAFVEFYNVTVTNFSEIKVYDSFTCNENSSLDVDKLYIQEDSVVLEEDAGPYGESAHFYGAINVNELHIEGSATFTEAVHVNKLYITGGYANFGYLYPTYGYSCELTVTGETVVNEGTYIKINGSAQMADLTVNGDNSEDIYIFLCGTWEMSEEELTLNNLASLELVGSVINNRGPINIYLDSYQPDGEGYVNISTFPEGVEIVSISNENAPGSITAELFSTDGVSLMRQGDKIVTAELIEKFALSYYVYTQVGDEYWGEEVEVGRYATAEEVVEAMKENPNRDYDITLVKDYEMLEGEVWDFTSSEVNLRTTLSLYDWEEYGAVSRTISVPDGVNATIKVDSIEGWSDNTVNCGCIDIGSNATLNLYGDKPNYGPEERYLNINAVDFRADVYSTLIIGEEGFKGNLNGIQNAYIADTCSWTEAFNLNLVLNDGVTWKGNWRTGAVVSNEKIMKKHNYDYDKYTQDDEYIDLNLKNWEDAIYLASLTVNSMDQNVVVGELVQVETLNVSGQLACDNLTANAASIEAGSYIETYADLMLKNISINKIEDKNYIGLGKKYIYINKSKYAESEGNVSISGSLTCEDGATIILDKSAENITPNAYGGWRTDDYPAGVKLYNNESMLTLCDITTDNLKSRLLYQLSDLIKEDNLLLTIEERYGNHYVTVVDVDMPVYVENTKNGDFSTGYDLDDAKGFIEDNSESVNGNGAYEIRLQETVKTISGNDLDYSNIKADHIKLNLNGYSVNMNKDEQVVSLDEIVGVNDSGTKGTINMVKSTIFKPRATSNNEGERPGLHVDGVTLKSNTTDLTIGDSNTYDSGYVRIENSTFSGNVNNLYVNTDFDLDTSSKLTITNELAVDRGSRGGQSERSIANLLSPVSVKNVRLEEESYLRGSDLAVSGMLTTENTSCLGIHEGGKVTLNNIHVKRSLKEEYKYWTFVIQHNKVVNVHPDDYERVTRQVNPELPDFDKAEVVNPMGTLTISGMVTSELSHTPVCFSQYVTGIVKVPVEGSENGETRDDRYEWEIEFKDRTPLATVSKESADKFTVQSQDGSRCTRKEGTSLQAATIVLRVRYDELGIEKSYSCLEDAVAAIPKDFVGADGKTTLKGSYSFDFVKDTEITKDVTIPDCVTELHLNTDGFDANPDEEVFEFGGNILRHLFVDGHTINTKATVHMDGGLRLVSRLTDEEGKPIAGILNLNGTQQDALFINEGNQPLVDENGNLFMDEGQEQEHRFPALRHMKVNAKNGIVRLYEADINQHHNMGATIITAKEVEINRGNWICDSITATNLKVNAHWENENCEKATLEANTITINKGGFMEVRGRVGSYNQRAEDETSNMLTWNENNPVLTLNGAKLYVESECYLNKLTVTAAHAGDTMGDYTVENKGQFFVSTIEMKAGTLYNEGNMLADNISHLKDFHNDASLICNNFNQLAGSKTYLSGGSKLLINDKGTVYNVNLGSKHGGDGDPTLGLGQKEVKVKKDDETTESQLKNAEIALKGTFTVNEEHQKLDIIVTDTYVEIDKLQEEKTYCNPYGYLEKWDKQNNPNNGEGNEGDGGEEENGTDEIAHLITLEPKATLFTTDNKAFPVEFINVHPQYKLDEKGEVIPDTENPVEPVKNTYTAAIQDGTTVRVAGESISLHSVQADGREWSYMKNFTSWKDAVNYLNAVGNTDTEYALYLEGDIEVGGALTLPSKVGGLKIHGSKPGTKLNFTGDMNMTSPIELRYIELPTKATIKTNGKYLFLDGVEGTIQTITGNTATSIVLLDSALTLEKAAAVTAGRLELIGSTLKTGKDVTATTLLMYNIATLGENETIIAVPSTLDANGKITATNMLVYGPNHELAYKNLEIKGTISSFTEDENGLRANNDRVYAVRDAETGQWTIQDKIPETGEGGRTPIWGKDYVDVKENALYLNYKGGALSTETTLATAPKIASTWFISKELKEIKEGDKVTGYTECLMPTRKDGNAVKYGLKETNVQLAELQLQSPQGNITLDSFDTLQKAFDEIDRIGDIAQSYKIVLHDDAELKNADYKFPSKAASVFISTTGEVRTISFKTKADIKCHTDFENITLAVEAASGTLNINGFHVGLLDSTVEENIAVTGSGVGKGSDFVVSGSNLETDLVNVASISKVDTVAVLATKLCVQKDAKDIGLLYLDQGTTFCGLGTIQVKDIKCNNVATLVTFPQFDYAYDEEDDTKILGIKGIKTNKLTISGILDTSYDTGEDYEDGQPIIEYGALNINLGVNIVDEKNPEYSESITESGYDLVSAEEFEMIIAKAPNVSPDIILFECGEVYKKAGNLVYKEGATPTVELSYGSDALNEDGEPIIDFVTYCDTFAEAVAEINNLKVKRDYTITFLSGFEPETLKMPDKRYANTLTLTSQYASVENERNAVPYLGELTFTTPVVLDNIVFEKMYEGDYPTPVNVKAGDNAVTLTGYVSFNTPILLSGSKKAELTIKDDVYMVAKPGEALTSAPGDAEYAHVDMQGKLTGFGKVNAYTDITVDGWLTEDKNYVFGKYNPSELSVEALNVASELTVNVGSEGIGNKVKVTDLSLNKESWLYAYGDGEFKNVTLEGWNPILAAYGTKFNITGVLTSAAEGAQLITGLTAKKESALNISGTAVLEDEEYNRIEVEVMEVTSDEDGNYDYETSFVLGDEIPGIDKKGNPISTYNSIHLLTAAKVNENVFLASQGCLLQEGEYDPELNNQGYFLKKNGNYVDVHYGDEVTVALYTTDIVKVEEEGEEVFEEESILINYYETIDEAIAAIKKLNDKTEEYEIVLLDEVGSVTVDKEGNEVITYHKLPIPENAKKVTFSVYEGFEDVYKLYNSNNITQKTDIAFENITVVNKGTWDTKNFNLELKEADVTVNGKATATNLTLVDGAVLRTNTTTTITDIYNAYTDSDESNRIITKPGMLTIKGEVNDIAEDSAPLLTLEVEGVTSLSPNLDKSKNPIEGQYTLSTKSKLAVLEKENMNAVQFDIDNDEKVVWASKAIYLVENDYAYDVEVIPSIEKEVIDQNGGVQIEIQKEASTICLDIAEASNYIKTVNNKNAYYDIVLDKDIEDAKVTDKETNSALTLPDKDKAEHVTLRGAEEQSATLTFAKDVKVNGKVTLKDLELVNTGTYSISMEKDSDVKNGKKGESSLHFENVSMERVTNEVTKTETNVLKNITGKKGTSNVIFDASDVTLSGAISNVVDLKLNHSEIVTNAKSDVQNLYLNDSAVWEAMASTTIGNVELQENSGETYIATYYPIDKKGNVTENPQLTITGTVNSVQNPLTVMVYGKGDENTPIKPLENYSGKKIVLAKTEAASKFIPYIPVNDAVANKDKSGYVSYTDLSKMQVILSQKVKDGGWTESYVATYAEAINIINSFGTKTDEYKITLLDEWAEANKALDTQKPATHKTAVDKTGKVTSGAFALPAAGKALSLTIDGRAGEEGDCNTIEYTGAITANCNLVFEDVILKETDSKGNIVENTLKPGNYDVDMSDDVTTEKADGYKASVTGQGDIATPELVFKTIDGSKGGVDFGSATAYVTGEIKLDRLNVSGGPKVIGKNKVTINNIEFNGSNSTLDLIGEKATTITTIEEADECDNNKLDITTYYTNKELTKSTSQLSIKGIVDDDVVINVKPMIYNTKLEKPDYEPMTAEQMDLLLINASAKPQAFQKVITAPMMVASESVTLSVMQNEEWNNRNQDDQLLAIAVKQDGALYFTRDEFTITVTGTEYETAVDEYGVEYEVSEERVYTGQFFNWEQAVKEIDKLNKKEWTYDIRVLKDQGIGTPLKSVNMPSKAAEVRVHGDGNNDIGILTTSTSIAMKVPTTFMDKISLCAVKKTGNSYYSVPLTLNAANTQLVLIGMNPEAEYDDTGHFRSELKLSGSAKGIITVVPMDHGYLDIISQVSGAGEVVFAPANNEHGTNYYVKDGIKGVKYLTLAEGIQIDTGKSEVNVTNLYIGEPNANRENHNNKYSNLSAKNITVTGTTVMASAGLRAGTTTVGDGKITLTNVVFRDNHNNFEAKQDKNAKSLINIKGNVEFADKDGEGNPILGVNPGWQAVNITLYLNNSMQRKAQLVEGMTLLTAPKAASSLFGVDEGMGPKITKVAHRWNEYDEPILNEIYDVNIYDLYKSGNDIKYGKVKDVIDYKNGWKEVSLNEVCLWIGTSEYNYDEGAWEKYEKIEFKTFEEAVKAIDSMALYKDPNAKVFEEYTIELMNEVEIGNDKNDGKYSALTLPSKASEVTIMGWRGISFSGNVTLKCNTRFQGMGLMPMKAVKGGAEPTTTNVNTGNFTWTVKWIDIGSYTENGYVNGLSNVSGGAKGRLVVCEETYLEANNVTGVAVEFAGNGEDYIANPKYNPEDEYSDEFSSSFLGVTGNLTTKELKFRDYAYGRLWLGGKTAIDAIYVEGDNKPVLQVREGNIIQLKGATRTLADKTKITDSVFFDASETTHIEPIEKIELGIYSVSGEEIPTGTKVLTSKYLNPTDWKVITYDMDGFGPRTTYMNGNDLYVGGYEENFEYESMYQNAG